jgi:hypothetical protein
MFLNINYSLKSNALNGLPERPNGKKGVIKVLEMKE